MLNNVYNITFENKDGNVWCSELKAKSKWDAVNKARQQLLSCLKDSKIVERYLDNPITHSIVFGGLEPIEQFDEMLDLIKEFRSRTDDDIVIYTGFYENEIQEQIECLKGFKNIIVKFGRFKMNGNKHLDEILGVELANEEQYARRVS